ncbi:3-hydroxybutyrate oligomer hydrolase family protein [Paraburkholderia dipogonis]|uniref:3-hydroxybutyrate oligomer hydrolase family protein n=1 Tax=Paraburkholderia dipogonis TaxID=1211383 RepID=UPI0035ECB2BE
MRLPAQVSVAQGGVPVGAFGKPLADYMTLANQLQTVRGRSRPPPAGAPYLTALPLGHDHGRFAPHDARRWQAPA